MAQEGAAGCGSSKLDTPAAIRHIAALLDDIAAALLKGQKKSLIALPVDVANEVHGLQRFHDGFSVTLYGESFRLQTMPVDGEFVLTRLLAFGINRDSVSATRNI
jgi:hypothetical protein